MAFNFGAFAGGLATGIQKAQELALRQQQLEQQAKKEANDKAIAEQKLMNDKIEKDRKAIIDSNKEIMESKKVLGDKNLPLDVRIETSNAHIKTARSMNPNLNISETGMFNYSGKRWITDAETSDIVGQYINDFGEEGTIKVEDKTGNILKRDSDKGEWYSIGKARPASSFENQEALKKSDFMEVNIGGKKVGMPISTYNDLYNKGKAPELWVNPDKGISVKIDMGVKSATTSNEGINLLNKSKTEKLTSDEVNTLWSIERNFLKENATTKEKELYADIEGKNNTIKQLSKTKKVMEKMVAAGIDGGIAQDIIVGAMKYTGSGGKLSDLTGITPEKFKQITGVEANLTSQQMQIIKDLSGLSYTDKQMDMMGRIIGNKSFVTNESKINAMNGYINGVRSEINDLISSDDRFARKFPHLAYSLGISQDTKSKSKKSWKDYQ